MRGNMTKEGTARLINTLFEDDGSEEVEDGNRRKEEKKKSRDTHGEEKACNNISPLCVHVWIYKRAERILFLSFQRRNNRPGKTRNVFQKEFKLRFM